MSAAPVYRWAEWLRNYADAAGHLCAEFVERGSPVNAEFCAFRHARFDWQYAALVRPPPLPVEIAERP